MKGLVSLPFLEYHARHLSGGLSDVLADVLRRVHLSGALFLRGEFKRALGLRV